MIEVIIAGQILVKLVNPQFGHTLALSTSDVTVLVPHLPQYW